MDFLPFFEIKKLLSQFLMPLPFIVLLLLLIIILLRNSSKIRSLLLVPLFLLIFFSSSWGSQLLIKPLEEQFLVNNRPITSDCFVMVLGSSHDDAVAGPALQQLSNTAIARLLEGIRQLKLGSNCKLVVSGWSNGETNGLAHADVVAAAAQELGISSETIIRFPFAKDTIDEAQFLLMEVGDTPFRLVTSAAHMPRAMAIFQHLGLSPDAAPTDHLVRKSRWWRLTANNLLISQKAIHEYVGMLWFKLKYELLQVYLTQK